MFTFLLGAITYATLSSSLGYSVLKFFLPPAYLSILLLLSTALKIGVKLCFLRMGKLKETCCPLRDFDSSDSDIDEEVFEKDTKEKNKPALGVSMRKPRKITEEEKNGQSL